MGNCLDKRHHRMKIYSTLTMAGYPKHSGILLGNFYSPVEISVVKRFRDVTV